MDVLLTVPTVYTGGQMKSWCNHTLFAVQKLKVSLNIMIRVQRLKAMAVEYQKSEGTNSLDKPEIIDAAYNHHIHVLHTCFRKSQQQLSNEKAKERS